MFPSIGENIITKSIIAFKYSLFYVNLEKYSLLSGYEVSKFIYSTLLRMQCRIMDRKSNKISNCFKNI